MVETLVASYILLCGIFALVCLLGASRSYKLSQQARGKELTQFYKLCAAESLSLIKWVPLWPVPVIKDIITLLKWRFSG